MLTSYHCLLSSLFAAFCVTNIGSSEIYAHKAYALGTSTPPVLSKTLTESASTFLSLPSFQEVSFEAPVERPQALPERKDSVEVAYRGSGRLNDTLINESVSAHKSLIAHRGSGRIVPQTL